MGTILGAEIIGGIVAIIFGIFVKEIRKLFPDVVTGTVIFTCICTDCHDWCSYVYKRWIDSKKDNGSCYNHGYFIKFDSPKRRDSGRNYRRNERIK